MVFINLNRVAQNFQKGLTNLFGAKTATDITKAFTLKGLNEISLGFITIILMLFMYINASVVIKSGALAELITEMTGVYFFFLMAGLIYTKKYPFKAEKVNGILMFVAWFFLTVVFLGILQNIGFFDPSGQALKAYQEEHPFILFSTAFTIGVCETYFFYAFIDRSLSRHSNTNWAGLIPTAIIFVAFHSNRYYSYLAEGTFGPFIMLGMFSVFSSILWRKTQSMVPTAAFHVGWDYWVFGGGVSVISLGG